MRLVEDEELSVCLTVSSGIDREAMLSILGRVEDLPVPQTFSDFAEKTHKLGKTGLLNTFDVDGFLITLENSGHLGAMWRTIKKIAALTLGTSGHYVSILKSPELGTSQYVEIKSGTIVANFDPMLDAAPEEVEEFFTPGVSSMREMINALEFRMETTVDPEWLDTATTTHVIDYRTDRQDS